MGLDPGTLMAGASVVSGFMGADAASDAASMQAGSAAQAAALQKQMFDKQVELQEPWRKAGQAGLDRLMVLLGLGPSSGGASGAASTAPAATRREVNPKYAGKNEWDFYDPGQNYYGPTYPLDYYIEQAAPAPTPVASSMSTDPAYGSLMRDFSMADFQADPGYDFRRSEGLKALERSAAARGGLMSGRAMKDTLAYSQGLASDEYGRAYDRFQINRTNKLNPLQSLAGIGQTAAGSIGSAAGNYGANAGNTIMAGGAASAAGRMGSANAISGGLASGWNAYQNNELMKRFAPATNITQNPSQWTLG